MTVIKITPSFAPKCPFHGCALTDLPFPLPTKGVGVCPESGYEFAFEVEVDEEKVVVDKNGNITKKLDWKVDGKEQ